MQNETVAAGVNPPRRRRWGRVLGLRALMAMVLVLGGGLGWVTYRVRVQRQAVAAIEEAGGKVYYDWDMVDGYDFPNGMPGRLDAVGLPTTEGWASLSFLWLASQPQPTLC